MIPQENSRTTLLQASPQELKKKNHLYKGIFFPLMLEDDAYACVRVKVALRKAPPAGIYEEGP